MIRSSRLAIPMAALLLASLMPATVFAAGPTASDDHTSVPVNASATTIDVLANDSGSGLTISDKTDGAHGTVAIAGGDLSLTYQPEADFHGTDTFDYTITDGDTTDVGTVTVDVNSPPVAVDDPGTACGFNDWGGAVPIPEDYRDPNPVDQNYFILFGSCGLLHNDTDPDGDPLTYQIDAIPTHGEVLKIDEDFFGYRPAANYSTKPGDQAGGQWISDSFTYHACDAYSCSAPATMRFWVAPINDVPTFTPGGDVTAGEDSGAYSATWATNVSPGPSESDQTVQFLPDGPAALTGTPGLFAVPPAIDAGGHLTFTPAPDAFGSATATFVLKDDGGTLPDYTFGSPTPKADDTSDQFSIHIFITADGVTAVDDAPVIPEDPDPGPWLINALGNDTAPGGTTITAVTQGTLGDVTISGDGLAILYAPHLDAHGSDTFTYTIDDHAGSTDTATVNVSLTSINDAPAGAGKTVHTSQDLAYVFTSGDFGFSDAHDTPPNSLSAVTITTLPAAGTLKDDGVALVAGGSVPVADISGSKLVFTPADGESGSPYTAFTFQVQDDGGTANGGVDLDPTPNTMTVNVSPNTDPVAVADSATIAEDPGAVAVGVLANDTDADSDTLTITAKTDGTHGTVVITGGGTGLTYRPAPDFNGTDSFAYTIDDGHGGTASATVSMTITAVNDNPVATHDSLTILEDAAATAVKVLANDSDVDLDARTITAKTDGTKGVVAVTGGGTGLTYKPNANANGTDTFSYTISDGHGGSATGTVTMTITPVNDVPNAVNDAGLTVHESAAATTLAVKTNDVDIDGDTLTINTTTNGAHGVVAITGGGTGLSYDPAQLYIGSDVFTYTIGDGHGGSDTATVLVTVVKDTTKPTVTAPVESFVSQTVGASTVKAHLAWTGSDPGGTGIAKYQLQVSVNGGSFTTVSLATATGTTSNRTLTNGKTYRYRIRATDKQGNVGAYATGPTFSTLRLQDSSASVRYSGTWVTKSTSSALGGSHRYTSSTGARASIRTSARDIAWVATKSAASGSAQVWIDGVLAATVNLHASSTIYRQLVFQRHFSTVGTHTIEIRRVSGRIHLDAFLIYR